MVVTSVGLLLVAMEAGSAEKLSANLHTVVEKADCASRRFVITLLIAFFTLFVLALAASSIVG